MLGILRARFHQGHQTMGYPDAPPPELPARFAGRPQVDSARCPPACRLCADVCPTAAIRLGTGPDRVCLDTGRCLFCHECCGVCPAGTIAFSREHRLAAATREGLLVRDGAGGVAAALNAQAQRLFGRSLKLRQVSAGGCNACEADTNVLNTVGWDLGRFGIQFVASPRHADGLLVTGAVSRNMREALLKTYAAVAAPKLVIAVGACAIAGGPYVDHAEVENGAAGLVPVDLYVPGCPPHPLTILDGLLRLLGRVPDGAGTGDSRR